MMSAMSTVSMAVVCVCEGRDGCYGHQYLLLQEYSLYEID